MADVSNSRLFQTDTGILNGDACIVIMRTDWNAGIVDKLEQGCISTLEKYQVKNIRSFSVPGAIEIPFGIKKYWDINKFRDGRPDCFIALGCVLRGETPHFDYVCQSVTAGITELNLQLPVPSIFGVLTLDTEEQALDRLGGPHGHKGEEAAITALKMIALVKKFRQKE